ncbi:glucosamine-6-phosphate deaminase [Escherichia coli]|nr:glucosamine-6-phosphate deaminase [Escherichia coli]
MDTTSLFDAPRDKRTYFREINYIAAAFQYQKKNYKSA